MTREAVIAEALSWVGTPYHHQARVKGAGVDCAQLLIAVYDAAGVVPAVDPGDYSQDWMFHHSEEIFLRWVESTRVKRIEVPQPGDLAIVKFAKCFSHGAILVGPALVVHAWIKTGRVCVGYLTESPFVNRETRFYSPWSE